MRYGLNVMRAGLLMGLCLAAAGCSSSGGFDPGEFDPSAITDKLGITSEKKLKGVRRPVFPEGVPGVSQGVPQELYKGRQPTNVAAVPTTPDATTTGTTGAPPSVPSPAAATPTVRRQASAAPLNTSPQAVAQPKAKSKPKPKPKRTAKRTPPKASPRPQPVAGPSARPANPQSASPWPAAQPVKQSQGQTAWPEPPPPQKQAAPQTAWPEPPPPQQQSAPQTAWPDPPPAGTFSR